MTNAPLPETYKIMHAVSRNLTLLFFISHLILSISLLLRSSILEGCEHASLHLVVW